MKKPSFARRAARLSPTLPPDAATEAIPFDSGHAFPGLLPDLTAAATVALTKYRDETLQYAPRPGLPEMREFIAAHMRNDGANVTAKQVMVVNGAKHGLALVCRLLLDEGDSIVVTAPTYFTAIPMFKSCGVEFVEVGQDKEGLRVEDLALILKKRKEDGKSLPKFIYNVPDFHNPTGVTMSAARRHALLKLASAEGIPIVEDSPYRKVQFEGEAVPSLKALDRDDNVYLLGTFSKLIAPGLRIGWVVAPEEIIARLVQLKSDGGTCPLTQRIILEFCRSGALQDHTEKVQRIYRTHRDRMVAALHRELPNVEFSIPQGGYYVWLKFPSDVDTDALAARVAGEAIIIPGSKFFANAGSTTSWPKNYVRLAFSHASPEGIDRGVLAISEALESMVA